MILLEIHDLIICGHLYGNVLIRIEHLTKSQEEELRTKWFEPDFLELILPGYEKSGESVLTIE